MRILVTGGTGFTGKALVMRLLREGHQVVAMDYKEGISTRELSNRGAELVIGSVTDKALVERTMKGIDFVHHLAASFRELDVSNSHYRDVNVGGTRNVLEAAEKEGVKKFLYCSTCGVHGDVENPPADENSPIQPADYYQRTKYEAEPIVKEFFERGMKTVIFRPTALYGPGDPERFGMIFRRVKKGVFPMFGDGRAFYHPLYVENYIDASLLVQKEGVGDGQVYLIADEEYVEIEDLVRRVAKALDVAVKIPHYPFLPLSIAGHVLETLYRPFHATPPIFPRRVDWFRQNRAFSIDKAKREFGYEPKVALDDGLRRTAEWYRREGYLGENRA